MTKAKISQYDAFAANNTDVNGVNIAEGCPPSSMNNMGREIMAALKRFETGADGDSLTVGGALVVSGTATTNTLTAGPVSATTLSASSTLSVTGSGSIQGLTVGRGAGDVSTNTAVGASALAANTTGNKNTAVGLQAMTDNTTGVENSAFGHDAMKSNTSGDGLTAFGFQSLFNNTTADANSAFGYNSLVSNTTGGQNTAMGYSALLFNTTGANNTAVGYQALDSNTTGIENVSVGSNALSSATTGRNNVGIGHYAGVDLTTGTWNTLIAPSIAGDNLTTGSFNVYLGYLSNASAGSVSGAIVIGAGNNAHQDKGTNTGFISPNSGGVYQGNNSSSWSTTSDQRLKKNIVDNTEGLEKINALRVRNFEYRLPEEVDPELKPSDAIKKTGVQLGVIAQEIQQVCPDCVKEESTGVLSVDSDNVFWHMVNAIKELSAQVEELKTEVNTLKGN